MTALWLGFLAIVKRVPLWAWVALALVAAGWLYGHARFNAGQAETQARWDASEARHAIARAEAITAARVLEQRHRDEMKAVADRFQAEQEKADEEHEAAVAALHAGTLRLRDRFRCPTPAGVPAAAADPAGAADAGARGLQREDSELLLRIGRDADAIARQLNALSAACTVR